MVFMNFKIKQLKRSLMVLLSVSYMGVSCHVAADDIEIYTGSKGGRPESNILLMLDVSGSMGYDSPTRMSQVKSGLVATLQSLPDDVKVGLGIYNGEGASIINAANRLGDITSGKINTNISASNNDGLERSVTKAVVLDSNYLPFGAVENTIVEKRIDYNYDDAEQCADGYNFTDNGSHLDLRRSGICVDGNDMVGLRFTDLDIPKNAKIISAYIEFAHSFNSMGETSDVQIVMEDFSRSMYYFWDDYPSFTSITGRVLYNGGNGENVGLVSWSGLQGGAINTTKQTPDLTSLFQARVNHTNWAANSNRSVFVLRMTNGGRKGDIGFVSHNNNPSRAAKIVVEYEGVVAASISAQAVPVTPSENNILAVRFDAIQVPSNVTLTDGHLEVTASGTEINGGELTLSLVDLTESEEMQEIAMNITKRNIIATKTYSFPTWSNGVTYQLPLTATLESVFGTDGWCAGKDLMFVITSDNLTGIESFEGDPDKSAKLVVKYDGVGATSCGVKNTYHNIPATTDDGYATGATNYISQTYLLVGGSHKTGLRFENLELSAEDVVVSAYLEFTGAQDNGTPQTLTIEADVSGTSNPVTYTNSGDGAVSARTNTAYAQAMSLDAFDRDTAVVSSNIAPLINQLIQSGEWTSGNAISLILSASGGVSSYVYSYEHSFSTSPKLRIEVEQTGASAGTTYRDRLISTVQNLDVNGGTPTLGSTVEAYQYFTGQDVISGTKRAERLKLVSSPETWANGTLVTPSDCDPDVNYHASECAEEVITGTAVYHTPMTDLVCETNNIVMITDGYPTNQSGRYLADGTSVFAKTNAITGGSCNENWDCINELTKYMAETDTMSSLDGVQNIYTNVIGFGDFDSKTDLEAYARSGSGAFYNVTNTATMVAAMEVVVEAILEVETTISTPGVSVNQNNRFQYLNELYYSVFKPSKLRSWNGNIKKYKLSALNTEGTAFEIIDATGAAAIDLETGFFKETSTSYWSVTQDGKDVGLGGAAGQLSTDRNLKTHLGDNASLNNLSLADIRYNIEPDNSYLTRAMFGIPDVWTDTEFNRFLSWAQGVDVLDADEDGSIVDSRNTMGAPLHGQPIVVSYGDQSTVFVGTNEGVLHAINAVDGKELMAYIPQDFLPHLYRRYKPTVGTLDYGFDLTWVAYKHDEDKDGTIGNHSGDFVYLYGGLRRGGQVMYVLDVTNIHAGNAAASRYPTVKYVLDPTTQPELANMGQTWSVPVLARMKIGSTTKVVLIYGGGYDTSNDDPDTITTLDTLGRQLYIVDAASGDVLWWASGSGTGASLEIAGMNYSITAKPNIVDMDNDGFFDYIYLPDLGGQVIKFKVNHENTGVSNLMTGRIMAKLGKSNATYAGDRAHDRKIFEKVALVPALDGEERYMAIAIGTGYRAKPLSSHVHDGLFMVKDKDVMNDELGTELVTIDSLLDVTHNVDDDAISLALTSKSGYKVMLKEGGSTDGLFLGEKIMGEVVVFNSTVFFTTYFPATAPKECSPVVGVSRSYTINLLTGSPQDVPNSNEDESGDETENQQRSVEQVLPGIAAGTKILYTEDGVIALTNTNVRGLGLSTGLGLYKSSWYPRHEKAAQDDVQLVPPHLRGN
jgi:type IV pilus assembly protein PilY1